MTDRLSTSHYLCKLEKRTPLWVGKAGQENMNCIFTNTSPVCQKPLHRTQPTGQFPVSLAEKKSHKAEAVAPKVIKVGEMMMCPDIQEDAESQDQLIAQ